MNNQPQRPAINQQMLPVCPYCGEDPAPIIPAFTQIEEARIAVWVCGNPLCRKIHSVQMLGLIQPQQPKIVLPSK